MTAQNFALKPITESQPVTPRSENNLLGSHLLPDDDAPLIPMTAGELLDSGLVGLWEHRTDIGDTIQFARRLRKEAERRSRD